MEEIFLRTVEVLDETVAFVCVEMFHASPQCDRLPAPSFLGTDTAMVSASTFGLLLMSGGVSVIMPFASTYAIMSSSELPPLLALRSSLRCCFSNFLPCFSSLILFC